MAMRLAATRVMKDPLVADKLPIRSSTAIDTGIAYYLASWRLKYGLVTLITNISRCQFDQSSRSWCHAVCLFALGATHNQLEVRKRRAMAVVYLLLSVGKH